MKPKKHKPIVHTRFTFSDAERKALSDALDFLMNCKDFSFDNAKIDPECAFEAAEKIDNGDCTLTRGELRASAKAVEVAIHALSDTNVDFSYIEEGFPGLISDLKASLSILVSLNPLLQSAVKDLKKYK